MLHNVQQFKLDAITVQRILAQNTRLSQKIHHSEPFPATFLDFMQEFQIASRNQAKLLHFLQLSSCQLSKHSLLGAFSAVGAVGAVGEVGEVGAVSAFGPRSTLCA
ncbi:hypothetical protein JOC55_000853 [Paenibacillus sacheonensis]|nr:hypothetical protein [Paenibacillus sacheonensis]